MKRVDIVVEGTVGAGKTSLIKILSKALSLKPFYELSDPMIEKFLPAFYENKSRWAFTLQVLFLTSRYEQIKEASNIGSAILDRSIFGDVVFATMLQKSGFMSDDEYSVYKRIYNALTLAATPPHLMIYIKIPTRMAIERIRGRKRDFELITDESYWYKLNVEYDKFFSQYSLSSLLILNAEKYDWINNEKDAKEVAGKIKEVLNEVKTKKKKNYRVEI